MSKPALILYTRSYCHLCQQMDAELRVLQAEIPFDLRVEDVDADPALVARYDELVPVLVGVNGTSEQLLLCHYFLDDAKVRTFLRDGCIESGENAS